MNNDSGVPLTLLRLSGRDRFAVIEMGANHVGEIDYLTRIAQPTIAVITNAASAHLEGFGSVEGVAKAKGEIFHGVMSDGIAIINADDDYASFWHNLTEKRRVVRFGMRHAAEVYATAVHVDHRGCPHFVLNVFESRISVKLRVLGEHTIRNALAAAAAAYMAGAPMETIQAGLESFEAVTMRLTPQIGYVGARIIDDSYNANPASAQAALEVLAKSGGTTIFVLGDMLELGKHTEALHAQLGTAARRLGIDKFYACGRLSRFAAEAFGQQARWFHNQEQLIAAMRAALTADTTVLVKGSRGSCMEHVVAALATR